MSKNFKSLYESLRFICSLTQSVRNECVTVTAVCRNSSNDLSDTHEIWEAAKAISHHLTGLSWLQSFLMMFLEGKMLFVLSARKTQAIKS